MATHPVGKKKKVSVSELKAHALQIVESVRTQKKEVEIYKRGKLVAKIVPASDLPAKEWFGSMKGIQFNCTPEELMEPLDVKWNVLSDDEEEEGLF